MNVRRLCILVVVFAVLLFPRQLSAMETDEHCRVSNQALRLALSYVERNGGFETRLDVERNRLYVRQLSAEQVSRLQVLSRASCASKDTLSYGDLVAAPDFNTSVTGLYLAVENSRAWSDFVEGEYPVNLIRNQSGSFFEQVYAARHNVDHFQDRALFGHALSHSQAVIQASVAEGNLFTAILLNAFGEHFLQDQFAPGHVITPRRDFHDAPAMAMHDHYNRRGWDYAPRNAAELEALLSEDASAELQALVERLDTGTGGSAIDKLRAWLRTFPADSGGTDGRKIRLFGDSYLKEHPEQELFMILVSARSVADVLESYLSRREVNHFANYQWVDFRIFRGPEIHFPSAGIRYGRYIDMWVTGIAGVLTFDRIVVFEIGTQSLPTGEMNSRWTGTVETLFSGNPGPHFLTDGNGKPVFPLIQLGILLGGSVVADGESIGAGPHARIMFPLRRVDVELGGIGGYRWYKQGGSRDQAWHFGAVAEIAIGLFGLGVQLGREPAFDADGDLRGTFGITTNLILGGPAPRIGKAVRKLPKAVGGGREVDPRCRMIGPSGPRVDRIAPTLGKPRVRRFGQAVSPTLPSRSRIELHGAARHETGEPRLDVFELRGECGACNKSLP